MSFRSRSAFKPRVTHESRPLLARKYSRTLAAFRLMIPCHPHECRRRGACVRHMLCRSSSDSSLDSRFTDCFFLFTPFFPLIRSDDRFCCVRSVAPFTGSRNEIQREFCFRMLPVSHSQFIWILLSVEKRQHLQEMRVTKTSGLRGEERERENRKDGEKEGENRKPNAASVYTSKPGKRLSVSSPSSSSSFRCFSSCTSRLRRQSASCSKRAPSLL